MRCRRYEKRLSANGRRHTDRSPSTRHSASIVSVKVRKRVRRYGGSSASLRPFGRLRSAGVAFGSKRHRRGDESRFAKRSVATGEAGLTLTRPRVDGSPTFEIARVYYS